MISRTDEVPDFHQLAKKTTRRPRLFKTIPQKVTATLLGERNSRPTPPQLPDEKEIFLALKQGKIVIYNSDGQVVSNFDNQTLFTQEPALDYQNEQKKVYQKFMEKI